MPSATETSVNASSRPDRWACAALGWLLAASLGASAPRVAAAQGTDSTAAVAPDAGSILVLIGPSAEAAEASERYRVELQLALEDLDVRAVDVDPGFAETPLPRQLERVRGLLEARRSVAATWLTPVSAERVLVHVAVLSSGRVLVRMIEGNPRRAGFATDLAMASRELLGTAYLFEPTPPPQVRRVVQRTRAAVRSPDEPAPPWRVLLRARAQGGVATGLGASVQLGAELALERRMVEGLRGRVALGFGLGFLDEGLAGPPISQTAVAAGVGLSYLWAVGELRVGPALDVHAVQTILGARSRPSLEQEFVFWGVQLALGLDLRWVIGGVLELALGGGITASPTEHVLRLRSTGEALHASPTMGWHAGLGAAYAF